MRRLLAFALLLGVLASSARVRAETPPTSAPAQSPDEPRPAPSNAGPPSSPSPSPSPSPPSPDAPPSGPSSSSPPAACPPGQQRTVDTAGQCCWPGQAFSRAAGACVGVPRCPDGLRADGESCIAAAPAPSPPSSPSTMVPPPVAVPPVGTVPVDVLFVPQLRVHTYAVEVDGARQPCTTPCSLRLLPGEHSLVVGGDVSYRATFHLPPRPVRVVVRQPIRGRIIASIVTAVLAAGVVAIGAATYAASSSSSSSSSNPFNSLGFLTLLGGGGGVVWGGVFFYKSMRSSPSVRELGEDKEIDEDDVRGTEP